MEKPRFLPLKVSLIAILLIVSVWAANRTYESWGPYVSHNTGMYFWHQMTPDFDDWNPTPVLYETFRNSISTKIGGNVIEELSNSWIEITVYSTAGIARAWVEGAEMLEQPLVDSASVVIIYGSIMTENRRELDIVGDTELPFTVYVTTDNNRTYHTVVDPSDVRGLD